MIADLSSCAIAQPPHSPPPPPPRAIYQIDDAICHPPALAGAALSGDRSHLWNAQSDGWRCILSRLTNYIMRVSFSTTDQSEASNWMKLEGRTSLRGRWNEVSVRGLPSASNETTVSHIFCHYCIRLDRVEAKFKLQKMLRSLLYIHLNKRLS